MASKFPSYDEALSQTKHLTLNTRTLEKDVHALENNPVQLINPRQTEINVWLKKELCKLKKQLKIQRQYIWIGIAVTILTVISLSIAIGVLHDT